MIKYLEGDLLKSNCDIICHQVNIQGVMGGGLAFQIANKYPECERQYEKFVMYNGDLCFGNVDFYESKNFYIANCFSQNEDFTTNYELVAKCFKIVKGYSKEHNLKRIGIPYNYGCGIASGDWNEVEKIIKEVFQDEKNLTAEIWRYDEEVLGSL